MDNIERTKRYFDKNVERLRHAKETKQSDIVRATALVLKGKLKGMVLDIGSGGRIDYSLYGIDKLVSLDISNNSLERSKENEKIEFITGNARNLCMEDDLFDRVLMLHTVHHLAGNNLISTYKSVENSLRQSHRVLKKAGRLLIIDAICPRMVQGLENILFSFSSLVLDLWDKPMVYYFSLSGLIQILGKVGFKEITFSYLDTGSAQLRPFTSSVGIPFKYTPLCHVLIKGIK